MGWDRGDRLHSVLIFAIKLRQLLTGEGYVLLKVFGDSLRCSSGPTMPTGLRRSRKPTPSLIRERRTDEMILDLTREIIHLLTREVPIRCQDVTVHFSMEEWEYLEGHKDQYKDMVMMGNILDSKTMDQDGNHVVEKIFHVTQEIIHLLTKEKYILIWNHGNHTALSGTDRGSGLITEPSPPLLKHERKNDGKIMDLTNKILHLLTGEVPVRYEDITVYFSVEEWEYVEGQKELYKDVMMDNEMVASYDKSSSPDLTVEKPLECPNLDKDFSESSCVPTHNPPHQVVKSTNSCPNQPNIRKHKKNHKEQTPVPCCKCGKPLKRTDVRRMETTDPIGSKMFCRKCLLDEGSKDTKKKKSFSCLECGRCFTRKYTLEIHLRIHTLSKIFPCSECGKVFTNNTNLEIHMRVHTGASPYKCSECGKHFPSDGSLQAHYRVHTGERPFPCSECDKTFRYKSHLVAHQRYHTGQTLQCPECGKHFVHQSHYVAHLRIHTGEKPFKCLECGKGFHQYSHLTQHERSHTGELPFKCEECGKCFRRHDQLFIHQNTHVGAKPFSCSECGKCFTRIRHLNDHKMIHTGEKPYSCPECGKLYHTNKSMLRHLKVSHTRKKS